MISATIIADSKNIHGNRITTFVLKMARLSLSEFNTHRAFSRNSASSRAIPFPKMLEMVEQDPFIPIAWMKDHKGMQGTEYFTNKDLIQESLDVHTPSVEYFKRTWLEARDAACFKACHLHNKSLTKQIVNRLLEPYMWHTCLLTATDFENFFALRAHPAAEIHIQDLAEKMLVAYNESTPVTLKAGEWHMPFGDQLDKDRLDDLMLKEGYETEREQDDMEEVYRIIIATARAARVSYNNFEGKDDYFADVKLHSQLTGGGHWSPTEHCAEAQDDDQYHGNFRGFKQYRKFFPDENKTDSRVIKK